MSVYSVPENEPDPYDTETEFPVDLLDDVDVYLVLAYIEYWDGACG